MPLESLTVLKIPTVDWFPWQMRPRNWAHVLWEALQLLWPNYSNQRHQPESETEAPINTIFQHFHVKWAPVDMFHINLLCWNFALVVPTVSKFQRYQCLVFLCKCYIGLCFQLLLCMNCHGNHCNTHNAGRPGDSNCGNTTMPWPTPYDNWQMVFIYQRGQ